MDMCIVASVANNDVLDDTILSLSLAATPQMIGIVLQAGVKTAMPMKMSLDCLV